MAIEITTAISSLRIQNRSKTIEIPALAFDGLDTTFQLGAPSVPTTLLGSTVKVQVNGGPINDVIMPWRVNVPHDNTYDGIATEIDDSRYHQGGLAFTGRDGTRFIVVSDLTQDAFTSGDKLQYYKSVDGGKTWTGPTTLVSDSTYTTWSSSGGVLPNGRIIILYGRNAVTTGTLQDLRVIYSDDNFATTSTSVAVGNQSMTSGSAYGPMAILDDGSIIVSWYGNDGTNYKCFAVKSSDGGVTWSNTYVIATSAVIQYTEPAIIATGGNSLLCMIRNYTGSLYTQLVSTNGGVTWTNQGTTALGLTSTATSIWLGKYIDSAGNPMVAAVYTDAGSVYANIGRMKSVIAGTTGWLSWAIVAPNNGVAVGGNGEPVFEMINGSPRLWGWVGNKKSTTNSAIAFLNYSLPASIYGIQALSAPEATQPILVGLGGNFDPVFSADVRNSAATAGYGMSAVSAGAPTDYFGVSRGFALWTRYHTSNLGSFLATYSKATTVPAFGLMSIMSGEPSSTGYPIELAASQKISASGVGTIASTSKLLALRNYSTLVFSLLGDGMINTYKSVTTAGWGLHAVYGSGRVTAQTAAATSIATYTVGAADGSFLIAANVNVTTSTTHSFGVVITYTDETNTSRSLTLPMVQLAGTVIAAITNITGAGPYEGVTVQIRCKAATAITITTSGTFTTVTYNAEGSITQVS